MIVNILVFFVGLFIYLLLFWKKLKDDYSEEIIFSSAFIVVILGLIGAFVATRFLDRYWFWGFVIFSTIGFFIKSYKYKTKKIETLEAYALSFLPWMGILFLKDAVVNNKISSLILFFSILIFVAIFILLEGSYKRFTWYKSGKVGFVGLSVVGLFFLTRAISSLYIKDLYSFAEGAEPIFSGIFALFSFLLLFNLSKTK